jgi:hypothetical protein
LVEYCSSQPTPIKPTAVPSSLHLAEWADKDTLSDPSSPAYEVKNQRDHCHNEKDVNQTTRDVKHAETKQPRHKQHHKENSENTHASPPLHTMPTRIDGLKWGAPGIQVTKGPDVSV